MPEVRAARSIVGRAGYRLQSTYRGSIRGTASAVQCGAQPFLVLYIRADITITMRAAVARCCARLALPRTVGGNRETYTRRFLLRCGGYRLTITTHYINHNLLDTKTKCCSTRSGYSRPNVKYEDLPPQSVTSRTKPPDSLLLKREQGRSRTRIWF